MRKVKVWGGEHPDELAALACVDSLVADPIPNVSPGIANPVARRIGKRFIDINMANAFPGDSSSPHYEERRAVEVLRESEGFDVVVGLHNMNGYGENFAAIDSKRGVSPVVLGFLGGLGIRNLVLSSYGGVQRYAHNAFMLETIPDGLGGDTEKLRSAFDALANDQDPRLADVIYFDWYELLERNLHVDQVDPKSLDTTSWTALNNFGQLPDEIAQRVGYGGIPIRAIAWLSNPNEYGYWGELVTPTATPDDSLWPK